MFSDITSLALTALSQFLFGWVQVLEQSREPAKVTTLCWQRCASQRMAQAHTQLAIGLATAFLLSLWCQLLVGEKKYC